MATIEHDDVFQPMTAQSAPQIPQDELSDDMVLMNLLADIGGADSDAKVSVYRVSGTNRKLSFIRSYLPNEFSLEQLQQDIGAGDYRVQVRSNGGLLANKAISIEADPVRSPQPALAISSTANASNDLSQLTQIMAQGFQKLGELMLQNRAPIADPQQMRRDMMQDMVIMKQLFERPEQPAQNGAIGAIEMFMKGMEMAKEIIPKEGNTDPMDIMLEALKTFGAPIAQAAMMRQENAAPLAAVPAPQIASNPAQVSAQPALQPEGNIGMNPALSHYVNMLVALAKENRDPYLYADLIVDQVSEEEIRGFLADPDLIGTLSKVNPEAANYSAWINELKKGILEILTSEQNGSTVNTDTNNLIITHATSANLGRNQQTDADNGAVTVNP